MLHAFRNWRRRTWTRQQEMEEQQKIENLEFETEEDKVLFLTARLGIQAGEFWDSDVGVYLRRRCARLLNGSSETLANLSPLDHAAIAKQQVTIKAAQLLVRMVTDAIQQGEEAELEINNREAMRTNGD